MQNQALNIILTSNAASVMGDLLQTNEIKQEADDNLISDLKPREVAHPNNCSVLKCPVCKKKFHRRILFLQHRAIHRRSGKRPYYTNKTKSGLSEACPRKKPNNTPKTGILSTEHESSASLHGAQVKREITVEIKNEFGCGVYIQSLTNEEVQIEKTSEGKSKPDDTDEHEETTTNERLKCKICGKRYLRLTCFVKHMNRHEKPSYECNVCHKRFSWRSGLCKHRKTHSTQHNAGTNEKPFECSVCHKRFRNKWAVVRHGKTHTGEKPYECNICHRRFRWSRDFSVHKVVHTGEKPFECDICHKRFRWPRDLPNHKVIHTGEKPFECEVCLKKFRWARNLTSHKVVHTGEKPYECSLCCKRYNRASSLCKHAKICAVRKLQQNKNLWGQSEIGIKDEVKIKEEFECTEYKIQFSTQDLLSFEDGKYKHEENLDTERSNRISQNVAEATTSTQSTIFKCQICAKTYSKGRYLRQHQVIHTDRSLKCDKCDAAFYSQSKLKTHYVVHTDMRPFQCETCSKTFKSKYILKRHSLVHNDKGLGCDPLQQNPLQCKVCLKTFKTRAIVNRHYRTLHLRENLFECGVCGLKVTEKRALKEHVSIHTGEKLYECDICHEKFRHRTRLRRHLKKTGEKHFECNMCDRKFHKQIHFTEHEKTHTEAVLKSFGNNSQPEENEQKSVNVYQCDIKTPMGSANCPESFISNNEHEIYQAARRTAQGEGKIKEEFECTEYKVELSTFSEEYA